MATDLIPDRQESSEGFSNPDNSSVNAERSRIGRAWDAVLHGGIATTKEVDKVAGAASDAAPHVGNTIHNGLKGTARFVHGLFTGKGR